MSGTDVFERHRPLLAGVAYRMLGRTGDAEDIVQEAWLRWAGVDHAAVAEPRAYLLRVTTRLAIDRLRRETARRETYVGPWLPEPVLTGPDASERAELADSMSIALLVVLETLSPVERAVFVLREAFGFSHAEIAAALDRSEAAVRQLAVRARRHVEERRPRFEADRATRAEVTARFVAACEGGDLAALMQVLAPDVAFVGDGGGIGPAPRLPILGAEKVGGFLMGLQRTSGATASARILDVNGGPGILITAGHAVLGVFVLDVVDGRVRTIHAVANPEKLGHIRADGPR